MIFKFFATQWKYPTNQKIGQRLWNLIWKTLKWQMTWIKLKLNQIHPSKIWWKWKPKNLPSTKLWKEKATTKKWIIFGTMKAQDYLISNKFTPNQAQTIFSFSTRMANFQENFRGSVGHVPCPCAMSPVPCLFGYTINVLHVPQI